MQVICGNKRRSLDIVISYPVRTSDYLDFGTSPICDLLEKLGFLCEGLTIFGDNAYVNKPYTTSPFKAVNLGPKDAYSYYHSQVRIKIECAFGILVRNY